MKLTNPILIKRSLKYYKRGVGLSNFLWRHGYSGGKLVRNVFTKILYDNKFVDNPIYYYAQLTEKGKICLEESCNICYYRYECIFSERK